MPCLAEDIVLLTDNIKHPLFVLNVLIMCWLDKVDISRLRGVGSQHPSQHPTGLSHNMQNACKLCFLRVELKCEGRNEKRNTVQKINYSRHFCYTYCKHGGFFSS